MKIRKLLSIVMCVAMFGLSMPMTGCGMSMLSREREIALGEEAQPQFIQEGGGEVPDAQVQQYVSGIGARLLANVTPEESREMPWEFHTLDSAMINAFALPGGKVFVTRGLMARMENEAQLAGVIGHEIGHVVSQHIGKQMTQRTGIQVLVTAAGVASDSQLLSTLGGQAGNLYLLKFGRGQELEADRYGMDFMERAKYDPSQIQQVMQILEEAGCGRGAEMLSTHPHPGTRIDQAKDLMETKYAHTKGNPEYQTNESQYQAILAKLNQMPPPKDAGK